MPLPTSRQMRRIAALRSLPVNGALGEAASFDQDTSCSRAAFCKGISPYGAVRQDITSALTRTRSSKIAGRLANNTGKPSQLSRIPTLNGRSDSCCQHSPNAATEFYGDSERLRVGMLVGGGVPRHVANKSVGIFPQLRLRRDSLGADGRSDRHTQAGVGQLTSRATRRQHFRIC